ncbi:Macrolide export protein MacA [bioreactor metagenome]|uniref:Macrolide export protein MacA n=1 Tax=bioreactor metagenome TaxID=1076179 RepID=A0A644YSN8_9ZZZZ
MSINKKLKWVIFIIIGLIIVLIVISSLKGKKATTVTTETIVKKDIVEVIPANGKIKPVVEVKISPDVSGEIVELNVKEGDRVKKGQLIIKIKQDVYLSMRDRAEASLNATRAQYTQQKASLNQIELAYKRNKLLYEQKAISEADYENFLSQYEVAKEQLKGAEFNVKSASAGLKEAQENLYKTTIYAPMDGVVSKLNVEKGERVVGTSQMAGTEMLRIANFEEMEVLVDVNENDIIRIKQNDTATIEVDAYPNRKFKGLVTQIANSAKNLSSAVDQVTNFEVKIFVLPESYSDLIKLGTNPFRPGMSASVSIQTNRRAGVIAVPLQAITTRTDLLSDSLKKTLTGNDAIEQVFVLGKENKVEVRRITTGIQDLNYIEVLSGLKENDIVITGPYSAISKTLKDKTLVEQEKKDGKNGKNDKETKEGEK